MIKSLSE